MFTTVITLSLTALLLASSPSWAGDRSLVIFKPGQPSSTDTQPNKAAKTVRTLKRSSPGALRPTGILGKTKLIREALPLPQNHVNYAKYIYGQYSDEWEDHIDDIMANWVKYMGDADLDYYSVPGDDGNKQVIAFYSKFIQFAKASDPKIFVLAWDALGRINQLHTKIEDPDNAEYPISATITSINFIPLIEVLNKIRERLVKSVRIYNQRYNSPTCVSHGRPFESCNPGDLGFQPSWTNKLGTDVNCHELYEAFLQDHQIGNFHPFDPNVPSKCKWSTEWTLMLNSFVQAMLTQVEQRYVQNGFIVSAKTKWELREVFKDLLASVTLVIEPYGSDTKLRYVSFMNFSNDNGQAVLGAFNPDDMTFWKVAH